jgi:hypothetical protein
MAVSKLAPQPVAFYAAVFFLVNATYILLVASLSIGLQLTKSAPANAGSCASGRSPLCAFLQPLRPSL